MVIKKIINNNKDNLINESAFLIANALSEVSKVKEKVNIGLVGGTSVSEIYSALSTFKGGFWKKVHFFVLDERVVSLDSDESNFKLINEKLINPLLEKKFITSSQVHPIKTTGTNKDILKFLKEYAKQIGDYIDVAVMSSGEDNHLCAIFPDLEYGKEAYQIIENSPKPPAKRITITPRMFSIIENAFIIFLGDHKKEALKKFLLKQRLGNIKQVFNSKKIFVITDITDIKV